MKESKEGAREGATEWYYALTFCLIAAKNKRIYKNEIYIYLWSLQFVKDTHTHPDIHADTRMHMKNMIYIFLKRWQKIKMFVRIIYFFTLSFAMRQTPMMIDLSTPSSPSLPPITSPFIISNKYIKF